MSKFDQGKYVDYQKLTTNINVVKDRSESASDKGVSLFICPQLAVLTDL